MNILHTVAPAEFGGLEEVVIRLVTGLAGRGHTVTVACVISGTERSQPFIEALRSENVECVPLFVPHKTYRREIGEIRALCKAIRPDVVHTHGYRSDVLHRRAIRGFGIPCVTTLHGFTGGGWKNRLYEWLQVRSARTFDGVVAVSAPMAEVLRGRGVRSDVVHVIPNAWGARQALEEREVARRTLATRDGRFHAGWVGRLGHEKGPDVLLKALALLPDLDIDVSIVGDGRLRPELEQMSERLRGPRVRFHGVIPEAGRLFSAFDLLVLSSRTEGTPIVLFEAMAAFVPIIATSVGGVPDVIDDEVGTLVPSEDPAALADAIRAIHRDPAIGLKKAHDAERLVRTRYSTGPWIQQYERVYSDLVGPLGLQENSSMKTVP